MTVSFFVVFVVVVVVVFYSRAQLHPKCSKNLKAVLLPASIYLPGELSSPFLDIVFSIPRYCVLHSYVDIVFSIPETLSSLLCSSFLYIVFSIPRY